MAAPRPLPPLTGGAVLDAATRRSLVLETWFVMVAFLAPSIAGALVLLAEHVGGENGVTRFPVYVHQPLLNMFVGIMAYLPVAAVVPLGLFLLDRTGQSPSWLGLGRPRLMDDVVPGIGIGALAFVTEVAMGIVLAPLILADKGLFNEVPPGHVPAYYVVWGIAISLTTAVAEEVLVNGYLITRLQQLGWSPQRALILSLTLRTSYHVYYGLGFLFTIPFGYFVTRSFQKHRRLTRCIAAHFISDAVLFTIAILT